MANEFIERRSFRRLKEKVRVELINLSPQEVTSRSAMVETENISGGGIRLTYKKPFPIDSYVVVHLVLPTEFDGLTFYARVTWTKENKDAPEETRYSMGLSFLGSPEEKVTLLNKYVTDKLEKDREDS